MKLHRTPLLFLARFAGIYLLLILPWPGVERIYRAGFQGLVKQALCGASGDRETSLEELPAGEQSRSQDCQLVIVNRRLMTESGAGPVRNVKFGTRNLGLRPALLFLALALALASRVPLSRLAMAIPAGLAAVHICALLALAFIRWKESAALSLVQLTPVQLSVAEAVGQNLAGHLALAVPVLVWVVVCVVPGKPSAAAGASASAAKSCEARKA